MEKHPVRFTPEQIEFIQENLNELANQYAHVPEIYHGVEDIEKTIMKAGHSEEEINPDYDCPYCGLQGGH